MKSTPYIKYSLQFLFLLFIPIFLLVGCEATEKSESEPAKEVSLEKIEEETGIPVVGQQVVLPEIEHEKVDYVHKQLAKMGLSIEKVHEIENPLKGKVLKMEAAGRRVRGGDTIQSHDEIHIWIGK